jgi:hypothetical protein
LEKNDFGKIGNKGNIGWGQWVGGIFRTNIRKQIFKI